MRAIVQRVSGATVHVDGREVGRCGYGLLLLVGVHRNDGPEQARKLAAKISTLRIFGDEAGKMNLAILDFPAKDAPTKLLEYDVLAVSNFTVYGDASSSRRPSFTASAPYDQGAELFDKFIKELRALGVSVQTGCFGANMSVSLVNDGPVTLVVDVEANFA